MPTSRRWRQVLAGLFTTATVASAPACAPGFSDPRRLDNRHVFADLTYAQHALPPRSNQELQLYAALELEGVTAYANPQAAAACYRALDTALLDETADRLAEAQLAARGRDPAPGWGAVEAWLATHLPAGCDALAASDRALVAYSAAHLAQAVESFAQSSGVAARPRDGGTAIAAAQRTGPEARREVDRAALGALARVARLLAATRPPQRPRTYERPVLALSGGSANGAFVAGFLFELLWARERALLELDDPGARRDQDAASLFSGLVGTSVGALLSQVLDLYLVDPAVHDGLTPAQQAYLAQCLGDQALDLDPGELSTNPAGCFEGSPRRHFPGLEPRLAAGRPIQACALTLLHRAFTQSQEQDLMCVEPGAVTRAVGLLGPRRVGLVRFDAMTRKLIDPLLDQLAPQLLANDTTRVVVSVDLLQNQTLGLDERSCAGLPALAAGLGQVAPRGGQAYCLSSSVMASAVLPFFASPVRHTYSGYGELGECGAWIDGGLRSGFPVLRALKLSRPRALTPGSEATLRVLALETGRLNGLPNPRPQTIADVALNAIGQMANANTVDEFVLAQLTSSQRERELGALLSVLDGGAPGAAAAPGPATPHAEGGPPVPLGADDDLAVAGVYVPSEVPTAIVADSGYSFDPYVMRGLFTWGRRVAMLRILGLSTDGHGNVRGSLPTQLGWPAPLSRRVRALATRDLEDPELLAWHRAYTLDECPDFRARRIDAGHARVTSQVEDCGAVEDESGLTPHYFVCPQGALDLNPAPPPAPPPAPATGARP
jgi:hypothetical protein